MAFDELRFLCLLSDGVEARRVAVMLLHIGNHRVDRDPAHLRRGGIVRVDSHIIHPSDFMINPECITIVLPIAYLVNG